MTRERDPYAADAGGHSASRHDARGSRAGDFEESDVDFGGFGDAADPDAGDAAAPASDAHAGAPAVSAAPPRGRVLAIDVGARRTGLAISDATGTLARPLEVLTSRDPLYDVIRAIERLAAEDDGLALVVVGLPTRLDGSPNDQTARVETFVVALRRRIAVPVLTQGERLTSVEAESRLALREKDWRRRKEKLDAAAAAVILQDYLDGPR